MSGFGPKQATKYIAQNSEHKVTDGALETSKFQEQDFLSCEKSFKRLSIVSNAIQILIPLTRFRVNDISKDLKRKRTYKLFYPLGTSWQNGSYGTFVQLISPPKTN